MRLSILEIWRIKNMKDKIYNDIISRRSIRRFQHKKISKNLLKKLVNAARLAPSAANLQPLEFIIVDEEKTCLKIFENLSWAGYLKDWNPSAEESPVAYIVILVNDTKNPWYIRDVSFAAANIVITAENEGLGSCIICKINKEKIREILEIPKDTIIDSIVALGYKAEHPVVEDLTKSVKYWQDKKNVLHVPKRKLEDILHYNKYKVNDKY
jgi:nitroreductase